VSLKATRIPRLSSFISGFAAIQLLEAEPGPRYTTDAISNVSLKATRIPRLSSFISGFAAIQLFVAGPCPRCTTDAIYVHRLRRCKSKIVVVCRWLFRNPAATSHFRPASYDGRFR